MNVSLWTSAVIYIFCHKENANVKKQRCIFINMSQIPISPEFALLALVLVLVIYSLDDYS